MRTQMNFQTMLLKLFLKYFFLKHYVVVSTRRGFFWMAHVILWRKTPKKLDKFQEYKINCLNLSLHNLCVLWIIFFIEINHLVINLSCISWLFQIRSTKKIITLSQNAQGQSWNNFRLSNRYQGKFLKSSTEIDSSILSKFKKILSNFGCCNMLVLVIFSTFDKYYRV